MSRELKNRFLALGETAPSEPALRIEAGSMDDYRALSRFHYRSRYPGAVTGIIRAVIEEPSLMTRFRGTTAGRTTETLRHGGGEGKKGKLRIKTVAKDGVREGEMRATHGTTMAFPKRSSRSPQPTHPSSVPLCLRGSPSLSVSQVIGVLVISLPSPACRLRDLATADRYRNLGPREGTALLNREVRCISRVIVDPRFRGTGVAVQLVRHALDHMPDGAPGAPAPGVRFTEALAAMGRVNPFFERAGMHRYERPLREDESRLIDAMSCVGLDPTKLASVGHAIEVIEAQPRHRQAFIEQELRRWRRASARLPLARVREQTWRDLLIAARDKLLLQPVYFIVAHHSTAQQSTANHRDTETQRRA